MNVQKMAANTAECDRALEFEIVVLDIDGAVTQQSRLLERYNPTVISLQERHAELRYWCPNDVMERLRKDVSTQLDLQKPRIALYGTNNNHHMAYLWISLLNEPVTVIGFDSTSDCFRTMPNYIWAGSWAPLAAKLPHVQKLVLLGIDRDFTLDLPDDFVAPLGTPTYEMDLLTSGKVELYPNMMRQSQIIGHVTASTPCVEMKPDSLFTSSATWKNFRDHGGVHDSMERILANISTDAVYITIDKDGLREEDCFSNIYDGKNSKQGTLTIDEMLEILALIKQRKRILGVDICGDYSYPARSSNPLKQAWSDWELKFVPTDAIDSIALRQMNEDVNLKILEMLLN
ncbi:MULTISPECIES: hypothetical protein [unclassified Microcoleus]|jgi:hypothetical protein|uniref:hypothetical protein n=1 Tax=unclassified Microcoleus TaxID=2642155 RepID=UPI001D1DA1F6|nr:MULTISPECIES: hypothetical protein [unclassified Microcoleus]MCC3506331.1 hypothetical protein [Microcoleus sp. PH2017_19_SFW_U_A]TAE07455.1 MAG: hypothetical protein EAZ94_28575 [Oscillatoriales cyanobacterium]MCC3414996.1 hypothetical protein [Microcoleus sp. PH2017_02_FOX_O_A]MCC3494159.1 hypothetical protein [Microcoleus sp. PH2017_16_JOR_D_A]MCC3519133.1 hypothetical protein [Microcoleus sp. PH2017_18_LLB_O_A]